MSRGPATFRQRDMTAAIRAVRAAGVSVARVEVDRDGKIIVIPGKPGHLIEQPDLAAADIEL